MSGSIKTIIYFLVAFMFYVKTNSQLLQGTEAVRGELKHLVYINTHFLYRKENGFWIDGKIGAGTVINMNWVLTAAHVVEDHDKVENGRFTSYTRREVHLTAGTKDIRNEDDAQKLVIGRNDVYVHKNYDAQNFRYDVALIHLKEKPLERSETVEPAKFLENGMSFEVGTKCVISGWGVTEYSQGANGQVHKKFPDRAMRGNVEILRADFCNSYPEYSSGLHLCYGCKTGSCPMNAPGDSGAPVTCDLIGRSGTFVVAVHNFGCKDFSKHCTAAAPGAGTDVREIRKWMNDKMSEHSGGWTAKRIIFCFVAAFATGSLAVYYL